MVLAGGQANVCTVRSDSGITSMKGLVDAMRREPGRFNFSSTGIGSLSLEHMAALTTARMSRNMKICRADVAISLAIRISSMSTRV